MQDQEGYRRLRDLSKSNRRTYAYFLTYSFEDFSAEIISEDEFDDYITPGGEYISAKRERVYADYCRGSQYQSQLHKYGFDVAHLSAGFSRLENLHSIRISQIISDRSGPWFEETLIPVECLGFLELPTSCRVLDTIAASLCTAHAKVEALTLMSSPHDEISSWPQTGLIEGLDLSKSALYREAFSHLKVPKVFLPTRNVEGGVNLEGLSDFISSLPAIVELVFAAAEFSPADLVLPHLHSSSRLQSFDVSYLMTNFFSRHSASLRRVRMRDVVLLDGSWEDVFSLMRETLNLSSSEMDGSFYVNDDWNARSLEIGYHHTCHDEQLVLPNRCIEDFGEKCTDVEPFHLLRTYLCKYPKHVLPDDVSQCGAGVCSHYYRRYGLS